MQIIEFFGSNKFTNISFRKQATFFMSFRNREYLFNSSSFVSRIKSTLNKNSFINSFSINSGDVPFLEIRKQLIIINIVMFFIYNIRRIISPRADSGVGSPQSIHTILVLTINYHVFLKTIAFRNTYPNQPYTSHALHTLSGSNGPYCSVLRIHFTTRVMPIDGKKGTQQRRTKVSDNTDGETKNTTTLSPTRKERL